MPSRPPIRHDWQSAEIMALFDLPFNDLIYQAQCCHRQNFAANAVQISTLLSVKTGACPEDCGYCPQSARYKTGLKAERLMPTEQVVAQAKAARDKGATRFCMGGAWRDLRDQDLEQLEEMVTEVASLGLETCLTAGMLQAHQASRLKDAGLDYYNHNIDTSREYYPEVITTRSFDDRLETLETVRLAGLKVCCGGIVGMGESRADRVGMLQTLANLVEHPGSVPINMLVPVTGTPLQDSEPLDSLEFVRTIAVARIVMPESMVRLSAGRAAMSDEMQALCFLAGANSVFYGEKLLTTGNPDEDHDRQLFARLGIEAMELTGHPGGT